MWGIDRGPPTRRRSTVTPVVISRSFAVKRGRMVLASSMLSLPLALAALAGAQTTAGAAPARPVGVPCGAPALVAAIDAANTAGGGTLELTPGCTYTLTTPQADTEDGLPIIATPITIDGRGATITRATGDEVESFRIFEVDAAPGRLTLRSLTLSNGNAPGPDPDGGGGIMVDPGGSLSATTIVVRDSVGSRGGGIANFGTADISWSDVTGNVGLEGAGVANSGPTGTLHLTSSAVSGNRSESDAGVAGGVANEDGGSAFLTNTAVTANIADNSGGGVRNDVGSTMHLTRVQISGNRAGPLQLAPTTVEGGGIQNIGTMEIRFSSVDHNQATKTGSPTVAVGGGIANVKSDQEGAAPPNLTVIQSLLVHNSAADTAGGIYNDQGDVALRRSLVATNTPTNCSGSPTPVPGCSG